MSAHKQPFYWAIVHKDTGKLALFDGRCPIYWLRRVADLVRRQHGLTVIEYEIVKVKVEGAPRQRLPVPK